MRFLNALINLGLQTIAAVLAILAIPPGIAVCILLLAATTLSHLSDERSENP